MMMMWINTMIPAQFQLPSLKLTTCIAKIWMVGRPIIYFAFWGKRPIFRGELFVLGRANTWPTHLWWTDGVLTKPLCLVRSFTKAAFLRIEEWESHDIVRKARQEIIDLYAPWRKGWWWVGRIKGFILCWRSICVIKPVISITSTKIVLTMI